MLWRMLVPNDASVKASCSSGLRFMVSCAGAGSGATWGIVMKIAIFGAALLPLLVLAGCSATTIDTHALTAADLVTKPDYMGIYPSVPKDAKVIGPVDALLCQAKLSDRAPTGDDAVRALKVAAAQKGATALAEVSFGADSRQTDHCYSTAHAKGVAYLHN